ncbi:MAG: dihydrolipoyl dehydrogenase [Spirochaetales bacterium]|jgi:dihydrolipoamide dehydrogenase|nr:dihydrolipoyl dehydrogenase [Spirochaetales bacterium]
MNRTEFDVAVIGGGPAGYVAALKAASLGASTALVEKDAPGGTCLNRGCIPTKTYLKTAEIIHEIGGAARRGIRIADPSLRLDMAQAAAEKNKVVRQLVSGVTSLLGANGVRMFKALGRLSRTGPGIKKISLDYGPAGGGEGCPGEIFARQVILAGGSGAVRLPLPGLDLEGVLTSTEILDLTEVPERLAILGGGVIGIEMAMIFLSFGSRITVVEAADSLLPMMDGDVSALILKILRERGGDIRLGTSLKGIEKNGGGLTLNLSAGPPVSADKVLLSIGRAADLSCLGDSQIRIEKGKAAVNEYMETSVPGLWAPGDINGQKMLAHAAFKMGEAAAINAAVSLGLAPAGGRRQKVCLSYTPSVVYTFPEAASVGLTEGEARALAGEELLIGRFPLAANGKALAAGEPAGFVKALAEKRCGRILGVHMVGPGASEIINEAAALMAMEITVFEAAEIMHGHPTVSEALMEAAADCLGRCLHLPPKKKPG